MSTVPGDLTSVAAMKASTTGESVLRVWVPAAAAATTPKLAAAAVTTAARLLRIKVERTHG